MSEMKTVIADHPPKEFYAPGLEIDCQCARCGSSCVWRDCEECGGDGYEYDDINHVEIIGSCDWCHGRGGWNVCCSDAEWCKANPLPGRENIERGKIEWFTIPEHSTPKGQP